jgi:hypothetical protein
VIFLNNIKYWWLLLPSLGNKIQQRIRGNVLGLELFSFIVRFYHHNLEKILGERKQSLVNSPKVIIVVVVVIHSHYNGLGVSQKKLCDDNEFTQMVFIFIFISVENFCMTLFVLTLTGQGTRNKNYDILVLRCIGCVEPCIVMMMVSKIMV